MLVRAYAGGDNMRRVIWVIAVFAFTACGGGGSTPPAASDTPILYVPGTATVVGNPVSFTDVYKRQT